LIQIRGEPCYQFEPDFRCFGECCAMDRPLSGIKVVELAMWVAGPSTSAVLGDWGADVIKLEDPKGGDPIRGMSTRTL
jgi:crotonobetainyl-CoA:carnitine CoA-transferase CaiB-like acyl-CoA transferase